MILLYFLTHVDLDQYHEGLRENRDAKVFAKKLEEIAGKLILITNAMVHWFFNWNLSVDVSFTSLQEEDLEKTYKSDKKHGYLYASGKMVQNVCTRFFFAVLDLLYYKACDYDRKLIKRPF